MVYLDQVRPKGDAHISLIVGDHADQHVTATGRSMLFQFPIEEQLKRIKTLTAHPTDPTLEFSLPEYSQARIAFEETGYTALSREDGITRIAAPVVDRCGQTVASVGIFMANSRAERVGIDAIGKECVAQCTRLSGKVGKLN